MIFFILLQQIIGVTYIAIFFISLYQISPSFALSRQGVALWSLLVGLYVGGVSYYTTHSQSQGLLFAPTGPHSQQFTQEVSKCGCDTEIVCVRYAYTDDAIATTHFNTIALDSMAWSTTQNDPEAVKARDMIEKCIIPHVPADKKELHTAIQNNLSKDAQAFIFRHELGHVFYNDSMRRVVRAAFVGAIGMGMTLTLASLLMPILGGVRTALACVGVGAVADLLFGYASNLFFKVYEEKRADLFAAKFSSQKEIEAAASFFETYEVACGKYRDGLNSMLYLLPLSLYNGHIDGVIRARYLREIAHLS